MIDQCWRCGSIFRMYSKHTETGYDITYCASCFAPNDPFDIYAMRLMDSIGETATKAYAAAWREAVGAIDRVI